METVSVTPKFQIVIPRSIRDALDIRPGEKLQVLLYKGRFEFIPVKDIRKLRGFLKGIDTSVSRVADRV